MSGLEFQALVRKACHPGLFKYKPVPMEVRVNVDKILEAVAFLDKNQALLYSKTLRSFVFDSLFQQT